VKPELLRKVMAKLDGVFLETAGFLVQGDTDVSEKRKKSIQKGLWNKSPQRARFKEMFRKVPDKDFEKVMSQFENMPVSIHKSFKEALKHLPKDRGGRPSEFPPEIRRQAIQDVRSERARCDSLRDAIEMVAERHKMRPDYMRKVWKNRKRLERHLSHGISDLPND